MKTRIVQNEPNDPAPGEASVDPKGQSVDTTGSSATTSTNGFRTFVRRRELVRFCAFLPYRLVDGAIRQLPGLFTTHIGDRRCPDCRGLTGAGAAGSTGHSLAGELDLVRGRDRCAAAGLRRGDRSEPRGGRAGTLTRSVPAVVRGDPGLCSWDSQSHGGAPGIGAGLARLRPASAAI